MLFTELSLKEPLQKAIADKGYTEPTTIQEQVIPLALEGKNIVGQSQTGTGKTSAFLLPLLNQLTLQPKSLQALIVVPTRELVSQIRDDIFDLTKYMRVFSLSVVGGSSKFRQKSELNRGVHIVIATPGRLLDLMDEKAINLKDIKYLILDEVDRMLDMGFIDDVKEIRNRLPAVQQTYMFSATFSPEIMSIIKSHLPEYEFIKATTDLTPAKIDHRYLPTHEHEKYDVLNKLLTIHDGEKIIIFTQMKRTAQDICDDLRANGIKALPLHGDLEQRDRMRVMKAFKSGEFKILVTTDVAARGLNMDNVELVINYDVPNQAENYIHRVGRTGRAGAEGKAIMFVSPTDLNFFKYVLKDNNIMIDKSEHNHLTTYDFEAEDLLVRRSGGGRFGSRSGGGRFGNRSGGGRGFGGGDRGGSRSFGGASRSGGFDRGDRPTYQRPDRNAPSDALQSGARPDREGRIRRDFDTAAPRPREPRGGSFGSSSRGFDRHADRGGRNGNDRGGFRGDRGNESRGNHRNGGFSRGGSRGGRSGGFGGRAQGDSGSGKRVGGYTSRFE